MNQMPYSNNVDLHDVPSPTQDGNSPPPLPYAGPAIPGSPATSPGMPPVYAQQPAQGQGRTDMYQMPYSNIADLYGVPPTQNGNLPPPLPYAGPAIPGSPTIFPGMPPVYAQQPVQGNGAAVASLVLGIISMIAWLLPILGLPLAIVGVILGHKGRRLTVQQGMATAGLVLSYIALGLAMLNALAGAMMVMR